MVMNGLATPRKPPASVYQKVFDSRKRRVRGLWQRNGKYFANLTVADDLGRKSSRWVPLAGTSFTDAKADYDRLRPLGLTPTLRDYITVSFTPRPRRRASGRLPSGRRPASRACRSGDLPSVFKQWIFLSPLVRMTVQSHMKIFRLLILTALALFPILAPARVIESLDAGWRFTKSDAAGAGTNLSYAVARPWLLPTANPFTTNAPARRLRGNFGDGIAFAQPGFDDRGWRLLNLPHDFGVEAPFDQALDGATGKLPWWGVAWYRKHLDLPAADMGQKIYLDVDGAMSYAEVWLNGKFIGGWPYGYASWRVDLTPFVKFGGENVVAVRLDNPPDSSRWYPGGGIYRNVWLVKTAPVHVAQWGVYVTTPEVSASAATVKIQVKTDNDAGAEAVVSVRNEI